MGEKLPPMKQLATDFDVSLVTAFRAVQMIGQEGLVSSGGGRGGTVVLRRRPPVTQSTLIGGLLRQPKPRDSIDNFALEMIQGIREEISRQDHRLLYHGIDEEQFQGRMLELVDDSLVCGFLLDQKVPLTTIRVLAESGFPTVLFNRHEDLPNLCTVEPDRLAIARESIRMFRQKGYERIGLYKVAPEVKNELQAAEYYPVIAMQAAFLQAAEELGFDESKRLLIAEPESSDQASNPASYGFPLRKPDDWRRLGILTVTDVNAVQMIRTLPQTDLKLGRDVGIIGCFDLEISRSNPVRTSTWRIDANAIGSTAVRELLARVENPSLPASTVKISGQFIDRGTV